MLTYIVFFVLYFIFEKVFSKYGFTKWKLYVISGITAGVIMMIILGIAMILTNK